jgi:hypothetical protein
MKIVQGNHARRVSRIYGNSSSEDVADDADFIALTGQGVDGDLGYVLGNPRVIVEAP